MLHKRAHKYSNLLLFLRKSNFCVKIHERFGVIYAIVWEHVGSLDHVLLPYLIAMSPELFLSTRLEIPCPRCQSNWKLVEPTDILAARPVEVEVACPACGNQGTIILHSSESSRHRSSIPGPRIAAPAVDTPAVRAAGMTRTAMGTYSGASVCARVERTTTDRRTRTTSRARPQTNAEPDSSDGGAPVASPLNKTTAGRSCA